MINYAKMEKPSFTEILDSVKERLASPVFGTFIFTFLIWNWKIPVGLFLPIQQIKELGYKSYFELIEKNASLFFPIIFTLFYVTAYPWIRNYLTAWNNLSEKSSDNWWLERAKQKNISIPFNKYFTLREEHDLNLSKLKDLVSKEESTKNENIVLQKLLKEKETEIKKYNFNSSISFLQGTWEIKHFLDDFGDYAWRFRFFNNYIYRLTDKDETRVATVKQIAYSSNEAIILIIQSDLDRNKYWIYVLSSVSNMSQISGNDYLRQVSNKMSDVSFLRL